jgi:hypothetical protein
MPNTYDEDEKIVIITAYPLKKELKNENSL